MAFKRFFALLLIFGLAGCQSQTVTPADKAAFLTAADLRVLGYVSKKTPAEKWSKTAYGDGTFEMDLEVETSPSETKFPLHMLETLSDEKTAKDAMIHLAAKRGALNLMFKSEKMSETSVPKQIIYGDGSNLTVLKDGGFAVGNLFSARKKGRTFSLLLFGVAFKNSKKWDAFAGKKIRAWLDGAK